MLGEAGGLRKKTDNGDSWGYCIGSRGWVYTHKIPDSPSKNRL